MTCKSNKTKKKTEVYKQVVGLYSVHYGSIVFGCIHEADTFLWVSIPHS